MPDPVGSGHCANITSKQWTHLELEIDRLMDGEIFHGLGWVDFQGTCALPRGNALLPQRCSQSTEGDGMAHLHERIPLALRLGLWHLKRVTVRREAVEIIPQFLLCASCGDVADHHLAGSKPLQAARVQAVRLRPSAHDLASEDRTQNGMQGYKGLHLDISVVRIPDC